MLNKFAEYKGRVGNWRAEKISAFKTSISARWTDFRMRFPRINTAIARCSQSSIGRAFGRATSFARQNAVNAGRGALTAFLIGK